MSEDWRYQLRIKLGEEAAALVRSDPSNAAVAPIFEILSRRKATMRSQFDAFCEYVAEAERRGVEQFPLYKWTKAVIEDPAKKVKHSTAFTIYVDGEEVYEKPVADALEAELAPLVAQGVIAGLAKHDTNPANNPQPPAHLR
jgi:hypothetical protein